MSQPSAPGSNRRRDNENPPREPAQEVLLALGVRPETVSRLPELDALWQEIRRVGRQYPELSLEEEPPPAAERPGVGTSAETPPEVRARFENDLDRAYRLGMPLACETLAALDEHEIRPELAGYDRAALQAGLTDLEDLYESGSWRGADGATLRGYVDWVQERHPWRTAVAPPRRGEVPRIVDVLRRVPPATLRPVTKTRNRFVLGFLVRIGLYMIRRNPGLTDVTGTADSTGTRG
ncbi:hypothetical protein [Brachybacterium sp. GCM10030252]|uniref:hypothetical protein n=1 Tax=Brachybacterium sp. GCM10030252 TaxID=3273380 RepID=UPI003620C2CB